MNQYMVSGASGFIGKHLLNHLIKNGDSVLPVYRSYNNNNDKGFLFKDISANTIIDKGFENACIVHLIGPSNDEDLIEAIVHTTKIICDLGKNINSSRIIYLSGYGVSNKSSNLFFRSKYRAEEIIHQSGLPFTILRCSYIFGQGDELTPFLFSELKKGKVALPGDGNYQIQPVYIGDVVEIIRNIGQQNSNEPLLTNLLGEIILYKDFVTELAKRISANADVYSQPLEIFIREAILEDNPRFSLTELAILVMDIVGEPSKQCFNVTLKGREELLDILAREAT